MNHIIVKNALACILLHAAAGVACAQFVWIDASGNRQYSDQPPPASVPKNKILKEPALTLRSTTPPPPGPAATTGAPATPTVAPAAKGPMTTAEKNIDFTRRQNERVEKDKKAADEAKEAAAAAKNCERAQAYAQSLKSGERVSTTDKNGEKGFLSDEKRAQEIGETRKLLEGCK